ncbi:MAG: argininosuccinate lyase [Clostridiales bacterium]|nr:argininosuccinate lyase [Clostridiales bacterium]MCD7828845.1 argininosuccinate lyase [Clostridiales bacterium]MCD8334238.1 argininosuccinate lyase [Clostridiales bacterium]
MKLWAGRFQKETNTLVNDFNASIGFDARLYQQDITGSIAHATMLGEQGIISQEDAAEIINGLKAILADIEAGEVEFSLDNEDIHMNIETILTQRIGDAGKRLHTGRSRNDQVAVDFRLFVKEEIPVIIGQILDLEKVLIRKAEENLTTVMPGYTHLQRAQPTTFAHYMMAYANMLRRDVTRFEDCLERMDECPLGAGALATSTYPVDRERTAQLLGFKKPTDNSLDSVSDRDYAIEFLSACSMLMMHLSRFSEEVILWCSWEFKFVDLDDAYSTGSSIMPQKKNPDVAELVRGKTGRVYGDLVSLLTVMKGLPLAYNKDMQEDKEPVFDAIDTVEMCVPVFAAMLDTLTVRPKNMSKAAAGGFINATDCADYLTKRGMPFREAYMIVGRLVNMCIKSGETLETLTLRDFRAISELFDSDIYEALELKRCVHERKVLGGPSAEDVTRQINVIKDFVAQHTPEQTEG